MANNELQIMIVQEKTIIEIKGLTRQFKNITAVDNVSLNIKEGEVFGLLGPNGSGKTTLIRCLLGLLRPTIGTAAIFGHDIIQETYKVRKRCSLLPQEASCVENLTARENILYYGGIHSGNNLSSEELNKRTDELIQLIDLKQRENDLTKKFSGGMKRKVLVAMALVMEPDLLFLDEPTNNIDILGAQTIRELIKSLSSRKKTIFLTTHDLTDINELCDRVGIIVKGRLVTVGKPQDLIEKYKARSIEEVYSILVRGTINKN